jgi:hypothetical protein
MEKDCKIIFLNKQTYDFNSKDLAKALEWSKDQKVWAIRTPWGILQPMDEETFDNVAACVFTGPSDTTIPEDLQ